MSILLGCAGNMTAYHGLRDVGVDEQQTPRALGSAGFGRLRVFARAPVQPPQTLCEWYCIADDRMRQALFWGQFFVLSVCLGVWPLA